MTVIGISLVKDEADFFGPVLDYMKRHVDHIIVADNGSTDGTREIIEQSGVELIDDKIVGYYQSRKMSGLARRAGKQGADWIVPFDADEVWESRYGHLGDSLEGLPPEIGLAQAVLFDHVPSPDGLAWRHAQCLPLRKVAARYGQGMVFDPGNHMARYPARGAVPAILDTIVVRHFPYRSVEQFILKVRNGAAAYAATDDSIPADAGLHKRNWGKMTDAELEVEFVTKFFVHNPEGDPRLVKDPWL